MARILYQTPRPEFTPVRRWTVNSYRPPSKQRLPTLFLFEKPAAYLTRNADMLLGHYNVVHGEGLEAAVGTAGDGGVTRMR